MLLGRGAVSPPRGTLPFRADASDPFPQPPFYPASLRGDWKAGVPEANDGLLFRPVMANL